jgi:hypothetical protein
MLKIQKARYKNMVNSNKKTAKSVNTSLESTKKSLIYIDVNLKAISILLYFEPKNPEKCWVFSLG